MSLNIQPLQNYPKPIYHAETFEPMKLLAVTSRLQDWSEKSMDNSALIQVREDVKWLLESHLYYYKKTEELDRAYWGAGCKEMPMSWRERATVLEAENRELTERLKYYEAENK